VSGAGAVMPGLVSTVVPVRDRAALVRESVESVLAQRYRPIEVIVVDDGSSDDTPAVLAALAARHPGTVRVLRTPRHGPGPAREAGRAHVRGEFVQYLDSDDLLLPDKFALQVQGLRAHADRQVAYGATRCYRVGEAPVDAPLKRTGERIDTLLPSMLRSRWWSTSTPLYRREVVERAGPWTRLCNEEDWEYDCRIGALGVRLHRCDAFVSDARHPPGARQSDGGSRDPAKLRDRAAARLLILEHAARAGVPSQAPEMQHFARALFLLARQCGAAGLADESRRLFAAARRASGPARAAGRDFALYEALATCIGWTAAGRAAAALDRMRALGRRGADGD